MEPKFGYLLGAGASANSIPIVEKFQDSLAAMAKDLDSLMSRLDSSMFNSILRENVKEFCKSLDWLSKEALPHMSIDTLAKRYYIRGELDNLKRLKCTINAFFKIVQANKGVDKRYDGFFATLLGGQGNDLLLPENIKIISWNYDNQVEYSIAGFCRNKQCEQIWDFMNIVPRKKCFSNSSGFSIIKLNGTAGDRYDHNQNVIEKSKFDPETAWKGKHLNDLTSEINIITRCFTEEMKLSDHSLLGIHYAWESFDHTQQVRKAAVQALEDVNHLIVIGYSFPTFNREVDFDLLNGIKKLEKVYVQAPESSIQGINARLLAIRRQPINPIKSVEEFFIPFEYSFKTKVREQYSIA